MNAVQVCGGNSGQLEELVDILSTQDDNLDWSAGKLMIFLLLLHTFRTS